MSEPQCYFGVQLDTQCYKLEFWQTTGTVKLTGLFGHEGELTICFHHQQLFGNVYERRVNTAVEYLDHISTVCKVKNKFSS